MLRIIEPYTWLGKAGFRSETNSSGFPFTGSRRARGRLEREARSITPRERGQAEEQSRKTRYNT